MSEQPEEGQEEQAGTEPEGTEPAGTQFWASSGEAAQFPAGDPAHQARGKRDDDTHRAEGESPPGD